MPSVSYSTDPDGEDWADVDVTTLTLREAHELRLDMRADLLDHGGAMSEKTLEHYHKKLKELAAIPGGY
jgi:hypothetical protein